MTLKQLSSNQCFNGKQHRYSHLSKSLDCQMTFSIYLPSQSLTKPVPVIYWLSGLTCTDENFVQKAGAQRYANEHGVVIVAPDTSPRGDGVPDDPEEAWDFGLGAGFYINATQAPYDRHYHMYDYVTLELPKLIESNFAIDPDRKSIMGHSMGGHGAIIIALKNKGMYKSVSAFSPISNPVNCPWGEKAFNNYLGSERATWAAYDACELIKAGVAEKLPLLIDQGSADDFLEQQLQPQALIDTCEAHNYPINLRIREGYDHSYFFISSFIGEHIAHHSNYLHK